MQYHMVHFLVHVTNTNSICFNAIFWGQKFCEQLNKVWPWVENDSHFVVDLFEDVMIIIIITTTITQMIKLTWQGGKF